MRRTTRIWLTVLTAVLPARWALSADKPKTVEDPDLAALAAAGIQPTPAALRAYLKQFQPDPDRARRVAGWIRQLGSDSFPQREAASKALAGLAILPRAALEAAARSNDAETQARAKALLQRKNDPTHTVLPAALAVVAKRKVPGLTAEVLAAGEHCEEYPRWRVTFRALTATAGPKDAPMLRAALTHKAPWARAAAATVLDGLLAGQADADLQKLLTDTDERVRLRAARLLADRGRHASLVPLAKLLRSEDGAIRWQGLVALRWLSGKRLGYNPGADADERAKGADKWLAWARGEGATATLRFPVSASDGVVLFNGRDLTGWRAVDQGQEVAPTRHWAVKGSVLVCRGTGHGYLWYKQPFTNYELTVEWRWPGTGGDSGVWFLMARPGGARPVCLEAQLLAGMAGDFWVIGNLAIQAGGQQLGGHVRKLAESSEKPPGQWNRMTIRVQRGTVRVQVNGVVQNRATGVGAAGQAGYIALQTEGSALEFRHIRLRPLGK